MGHLPTRYESAYLMDKWLKSAKFILKTIPIDSVIATAPILDTKSKSSGPIIVDKNKGSFGRLHGHFGAPANIIVIDGKHRLAEAKARGEKTIKAYGSFREFRIPSATLSILYYMPKVKKGEKRSKYLKRCVPEVMNEGKQSSAAVGKCEGMYDSKWGLSNVFIQLSANDSDVYNDKSHDGLTYWKEVAHVGKFKKGSTVFSLDTPLLDHWHHTFKKMVANGSVDHLPLPVEHTKDPEKKRGAILAFARKTNTKGQDALYAKVRFRDAEAAKLRFSGVSLFSPHESPDGYGRVYPRAIEHVAITDYPVIPDLEPYSIALSFGDDVLVRDAERRGAMSLGFPPSHSGQQSASDGSDQRKSDQPAQGNNQQPGQKPAVAQAMTLRDLATQLGVDPTVNSEQDLLLAIANAIAAMRAQMQQPMQPRPPMQQQPQRPMPPQMPPQQPQMPQQPMMPHRPPVAMSLFDIFEDDEIMSLSKKQFNRLERRLELQLSRATSNPTPKKGKGDKTKVTKGGPDKLNDKSHFGGEVDSDQDDTYKDDEDNDAFSGDDNAEENEETMSGKGKKDTTLSHTVALSHQVVNILRNSRSQTIENLQRERLASPATAKQLRTDFVDNSTIAFSEGADDGFDYVVQMLRRNGRVIPSGKTGPQAPEGAIALSNGGGEYNPLMADAEARAKAAK